MTVITVILMTLVFIENCPAYSSNGGNKNNIIVKPIHAIKIGSVTFLNKIRVIPEMIFNMIGIKNVIISKTVNIS